MGKKYSTKEIDKVTDKWVDMNQEANTIHRQGLDQFEGHSIRSKGLFKLDIGFLKTTFLKVIQDSINNYLKGFKDQDMEVSKMFILPFDIELIEKNMRKKTTTIFLN